MMVMQTDMAAAVRPISHLEVIQNDDQIFLHLDPAVDESKSILCVDGLLLKERSLSLSSGRHTLGYELKNHGGYIVESAEKAIDVPVLPLLHSAEDGRPYAATGLKEPVWKAYPDLYPAPPFDGYGYIETTDGMMNFYCLEVPDGSRLRVQDANGIIDYALVGGRSFFQIAPGGGTVTLLLPGDIPCMDWQVVFVDPSSPQPVEEELPVLDVPYVPDGKPDDLPAIPSDLPSQNDAPVSKDPPSALLSGDLNASHSGGRPDSTAPSTSSTPPASSSSSASSLPSNSSGKPSGDSSSSSDALAAGTNPLKPSPNGSSSTLQSGPADPIQAALRPSSGTGTNLPSATSSPSALPSTSASQRGDLSSWDPWNILFAFQRPPVQMPTAPDSAPSAIAGSMGTSSPAASSKGAAVGYAGFAGAYSASPAGQWKTIRTASAPAASASSVAFPSLSKANVSLAKGVLKGSEGRFAAGKKIFTRDPESFDVEVVNGSLETMCIVSLRSKKSYPDLKSALDAESKTAFEVRAKILDANQNSRVNKWTIVPIGEDLMNTISLPGESIRRFYTLSPDGALVHTSKTETSQAQLCRKFDPIGQKPLHAGEPLRLYLPSVQSECRVSVNGKEKRITPETDELGQSYLPLKAPFFRSEVIVRASDQIVYQETLQSESLLPYLGGLAAAGLGVGVLLDAKRRKLR